MYVGQEPYSEMIELKKLIGKKITDIFIETEDDAVTKILIQYVDDEGGTHYVGLEPYSERDRCGDFDYNYIEVNGERIYTRNEDGFLKVGDSFKSLKVKSTGGCGDV